MNKPVFTLQLPPLEKTGTQPKLDLVQPLDSAPPLSSTHPPSTPPPPTTSQSGSMSLSATVRERLRTKLLKAKVREGGREEDQKLQKLLTHEDDNVYMYITVLVLFPGPSTLPAWRLGTGLTYNYMHM